MSSENDSNFLYTFTKNKLDSHKSIRWVGITDQDGIIINEQYREGLKPLLSKEENQESAINTIIRQKTRTKFEPKIGKLTYAFGRYENLSRFIIPINENYYLLLNIDFEENNFDIIIMEKILPLVKEEKEKLRNRNFIMNNNKK
ncbi:MAG TPA: hypothetical protein VHJ38_08175 [Nitrososphaeraceae archaeon]|nr:hypothetical protein [Nitrososphaeraceae archaeon]